jgi:hypothetical protein
VSVMSFQVELPTDKMQSSLASKNICASEFFPPKIRPTSSERRGLHPFNLLHGVLVMCLFAQPLALLRTNSIAMNST